MSGQQTTASQELHYRFWVYWYSTQTCTPSKTRALYCFLLALNNSIPSIFFDFSALRFFLKMLFSLFSTHRLIIWLSLDFLEGFKGISYFLHPPSSSSQLKSSKFWRMYHSWKSTNPSNKSNYKLYHYWICRIPIDDAKITKIWIIQILLELERIV